MATFTAAFTSHPANGTAEQYRVPHLVLQDTTGVYASFAPLTPDATVSTFATADTPTITKINAAISGMATEGITVTQTS
jgi:hypothetical protein